MPATDTERPAFYAREGDQFVPSGLGMSPWDGKSQNGLALSGLCAHIIENAASRVPMLNTRMTLDIFGAVPMEPLTPVLTVVRDGPRFQLLEVALHALGKTWVRASALRVRLADNPPSAMGESPPLPAVEEFLSGPRYFDMVRVSGSFEPGDHGPVWMRMTADVVAGLPITPAERIAVAADLCAGFAPILPFKDWSSANLDISLHVRRPPVGEWLVIDSDHQSAGNGIGIATARFGDAQGLFANATQTTFLDKRKW